MNEARTHKTITVSFQLRVPRKMRVADVQAFVKTAINTEPGYHDPSSEEAEIRLYKDRVEVFFP